MHGASVITTALMNHDLKAPMSLLNGQKRKFNLGPPPGKKVRSGVTAPTSAVHEDESESELEIEP